MAMRPRSSIVRRRILNADLLVADLAGTCQGGPDGTGCSLRNQQQVIDSQSGYGDLMIYLLPPVQGRRCKLSRQYCRLVAGGGPWQRVKTLTRVSCRPSDPTSWSRCSVTSSRCALCCTAPGRGADPHLRLDTEKRITRVMRPRLAQRSRRRPRRGAPTADQVHCTFTLRSAHRQAPPICICVRASTLKPRRRPCPRSCLGWTVYLWRNRYGNNNADEPSLST